LETYGGLANLFTPRGNINYDNVFDIIAKSPDSAIAKSFLETTSKKPSLKALKAEDLVGYSGNTPTRKATGGYVQDSAGVDTVPTMLSGGEFVMNNAATSRIGSENLEKINSGQDLDQGKESQEELVSKLEELIEATKSNTGGINITVNSDGSKEDSSKTEDQGDDESSRRNRRISQEIKTQVLKIIADEKRLGGSMRNK